MPFDSRKQQKWYHATDQTFYDDKPHSARLVKKGGSKSEEGEDPEYKDLTTTAGGDLDPQNKNLQTTQGSMKESLEFEGKEYKLSPEGHIPKDDDLEYKDKIYTEVTEEDKAIKRDQQTLSQEAITPQSWWDEVMNETSKSNVLKQRGHDPSLASLPFDQMPIGVKNDIDTFARAGGGYESFAKEESIASVAGPPADSTMRVMSDKVHVKKDEENLTEDNLTDDTLTDTILGEADPALKDQDYIEQETKERELEEEELELEGEAYTLSPRGYNPTNKDLMFEGRIYKAQEGVGNCQFCAGKGQVTVENLGIKDCPDCDGTGDIQQSNPAPDITGQVDPNLQPQPTQEVPPQEPQPDQPTQQGQIPQQPQPNEQPAPPQQAPEENKEKPKFGEVNPNHDESGKFSSGGSTINDKSKDRLKSHWNSGNDYFRQGLIDKANLGSTVYAKTPFHQLSDDEQSKLLDEINKEGWSSVEAKFGEAKATEVEHEKCPSCNFETSWKEGDSWQEDDAKKEMNAHLKTKHGEVKVIACEKSMKQFRGYIAREVEVLKKKAKANEAVSIMYGLPTISKKGKKIKGILAYAGVSLNDRIYLPEELAKGDGLTLPLLLNHSNIAGAEEELDRLDDDMVNHLENEKDFKIGEVTLYWDQEKLTLFYEGVIEHEFFQKEVDDADMAVSLGIYYDSDSPVVCDDNCYTIIKGAEFREVSLVYHPGFPIATIEAVENELKKEILAKQKAKEDHLEKLDQLKKNEEEEQAKGEDETEDIKLVNDVIKDIKEEPKEAKEDEYDKTFDNLSNKEEKKYIETPQEDKTEFLDKKIEGEAEEDIIITDDQETLDLVTQVPAEDWNADDIATESNFSVRGINGFTISNSNGVTRYKLDPSNGYENNWLHVNVNKTGAKLFGEEFQLQPKMTTPPELTKEIEKHPNIKFTDPDADAFKKKVKT